MEYYFYRKHAVSDDENAWADHVTGRLFLHGISNSRGVLIACLGSKSFVVKNKRNDDSDHV